MTRGLSGKRAIVTGGATGIGASTARRLIQEGCKVALLDIDADTVRATASRLDENALGISCDVRSSQQVTSAIETVATTWGGIDIVVNNAGILGPILPLLDYPEDDFMMVVDVDLLGTYRVTRAALPYLLAEDWGRIVNVSSITGKEGNAYMTAYTAAKAGVVGLTKALSRELATTGILVNCVAPSGVIDTNIMAGVPAVEGTDKPSYHPMGRHARPDEVAAMISWLCSDEVSYSTGAVFDISGGRATY